MKFNEQLIDWPNLDQVMDRDPLRISPDNYIVDAVILLNQKLNPKLATSSYNKSLSSISSTQFNQSVDHCVLVVECNKLLGLLTVTDIIRLIALGQDLTKVKIAEVMSSSVVTLDYENYTHVLSVYSVFQQYKIQYLPILDQKQELLGLISKTRLLAALEIEKMFGIVATLEQNVQPLFSRSYPTNKQFETIKRKTNNYLNKWMKDQSNQLVQVNQELQNTLEELQVIEEELRQQNEQLITAYEIADLERQRYRDLFEFAPDGYLVTNPAGIIQEANQAAACLLSMADKHIIGKPLALFIAPPENSKFITRLKNWQQIQYWEMSIKPREGEPFPARVRVAPVYDTQCQQIGWRWLICNISQCKQIEEALRQATDDLELRVMERTTELLIVNQRLQQEISERQRAEEALKQSEQLYRQVVEYQSDLIIRIDLQGQLIFANQVFCQTFGLELKECLGQSMLAFVHPDDLMIAIEYLRTLELPPYQLTTGGLRVVTVNGIRWFQWKMAGIQEDTGKVREIQAVGRDITESREIEIALRESEERFRHYSKNSHALIWLADRENGEKLYVNPAYETIWGRSLQSLQENPSSWLEAIHPEDRDRVFAKIERHKQGKPTNLEYRIIHADGSVRWIWDRGFPIQDEQGQITAYGGIAEDITERKQVENSLRESETRLTLALEAAQMGIWDWNLVTGEVVWSDSMGLLYGLPYGFPCPNHEEFIKNFVHPEDQQAVLQLENDSITKRIPYSQEYRVIHPDGSIHWLVSKGKPYYDQNRQPIRMIGTTRDITVRKQTEAALQESRERYRSVIRALGEGVVLLNKEGRIIACNGSAERILGMTRAEMLGISLQEQKAWRVICEDGSPFPRDNYPGLITLYTGQPCSNVIMGIYPPDGKLTWVSMNSYPLVRENETRHDGVVVSFIDISDRKQAEQKIYEQAALLDIATNAIFVQDLHNQILFWNKGAERLYGWQELEAKGKTPQKLFYSKKSPQPQLEGVALRTVVESGTWQGELKKFTKSGQEIIVESRWTLMFDNSGNPKSILTVETDITEKKQLQEQFYRTQRLESIGTLAGGIAHDLNNILTPILGSAQLLKGRFSQDISRHQQLLAIIEDNARRGADLVKQVLSFARGFKGERTQIQVRHLIREISQIAKQTFPKSIEFITEISEDLWCVCGDSTQLHQVLMNLVVNARDAMPQGGLLKITAKNLSIDETYTKMYLEAKVGNYIVIAVQDTGLGMNPEILDRIFEPFFTTKEVGAGTGLGLTTVLGITKSHDGFVSVSSQVGKGSEFKIFLPAVESTQIVNSDQVEILQGGGELILIVDDEAPIRDITKVILENHNYQTLIASNGIEAIALYAEYKNQISVVLMDMMMPEMDGNIAIRTLKKIDPQVQIIACTGLNTTDIPVSVILTKPYTNKELLQKLHQVLQKTTIC
ncbi:MAG TPA: PAS domain S-box protein [Nostocaceae cyanobacterium]|nr:PAS domain S-box protein [Nostocaceae cyanobacterium]